MGSCWSKNTVLVEEVNPVPHPEARRVWLISTQVDPKDIPLDLVGMEADSLKSAMRNRGLQVEHWALKVDPASNLKAEASIFDITVQGGKMVSQTHSTSSPYWSIVLRRMAIGWTIWKDNEIFEASKLLIQARPKYDGRANNSEHLARLLGRHIQFNPPVHQQTTTSETVAGSRISAAGSILKPDPLTQQAALTLANHRSQNTLVSGGHSQRSQSIQDSETKLTVGELESKVLSRIPVNIRHSQRMSIAAFALNHLSTAPSSTRSELAALPSPSRPTLYRSAETEHSWSPTASVRMSVPPQPRQSSLNPSYRSRRQTASEMRRVDARARTKSDAASQHDATVRAGPGGRRMFKGGARRRSEAQVDLPTATATNGSNSIRVRTKSTHQRDSMMSLGEGGGGGSWPPAMAAGALPTSASMMPGMPMMGGFGTPPFPMTAQMGMPMWPPQINTSPPMMFNPALQARIPPYFGLHPMGVGMPFLPSMPMLTPASPGFHSHTSSAVHTPPESPHLGTTQMPGKGVSEIRPLHQQHQHQQRV
ncbi:hypothetical protein NDA18_000615 [Ustilago nuda]|nr:hypothetical protein NDA18_000615 [Ustilago nuda]